MKVLIQSPPNAHSYIGCGKSRITEVPSNSETLILVYYNHPGGMRAAYQLKLGRNGTLKLIRRPDIEAKQQAS